ncbi:MAG: HepT-like ribonuclease domain-containing protein [Lacipirellulaceae bacterium]
MPREVKAFLLDVIERIDALRDVRGRFVRDDFDSNRMLRSSVERDLIVIGEALNRAQRLLPNLSDRVDQFRAIIDCRNLLVHGYYKIDANILWDALQSDLDPLDDQVRIVLEELRTSDEPSD